MPKKEFATFRNEANKSKRWLGKQERQMIYGAESFPEEVLFRRQQTFLPVWSVNCQTSYGDSSSSDERGSVMLMSVQFPFLETNETIDFKILPEQTRSLLADDGQDLWV